MVAFACWQSLRCHTIGLQPVDRGSFFLGISKILNTLILCRSSWTPPFQAGNGERDLQPIAFSTKRGVTRRQKDTSDTLSTRQRVEV